MEATAINSAFLFRELSAKLKKFPEHHPRVLAHVREVSGHATLPAFINNGAAEEIKVQVLAECLRALLTGDFSKLKGEVPRGQAPAAEIPPTETQDPVKATSWRCGCKTASDTDWSFNGLVFATADEAKAYGSDLFSRWTALKACEPIPCELPITAEWKDGKLVHLPEKTEEQLPPEPPKPEVKQETSITINAPPPLPTSVPAPSVPAVDPKFAAVVAAIQGLVQTQLAPTTGIEEAEVREIVRQVFAEELPKLVAIQIHEEVEAAKFELVQAIEKGHEKSLRDLAKAIAEVV